MLADEIAEIEAAEDLFALLGEIYQAGVLRVHRLHILKAFGSAVADIEKVGPLPKTDEERRVLYAKVLRDAHDAHAAGSTTVEPFVRKKAPALVNIRKSAAANTG
jgi:hypothetical protein